MATEQLAAESAVKAESLPLKCQLNLVRKKDFTWKFQVLKLKKKLLAMLTFKRGYRARWTIVKTSTTTPIWKKKTTLLLNEKKKTKEELSSVYFRINLRLKASASETKLSKNEQILICCTDEADPWQTHNTERREMVGIPECSCTHSAGQVQQRGCIPKKTLAH